jgi:integrase-like protein
VGLPPSIFVNTLLALDLNHNVVWEQQAHLETLNALASQYCLFFTNGHWSFGSYLIMVGHDGLKRGIISLYHNFAIVEHPGISKTMFSITRDYWWPSIRNDVTDYVKGYSTCQATKPFTI